ncbi:DUF600 domain-containing protein [Priestia koreensis]|uniref:DUF600 domain-containing protein n=1 Tax=Priestia koreensis TaxID=284581 RepID=UPI00203DC1BA|nr:DUF600 domain-containing protein [Priestia koreensis]
MREFEDQFSELQGDMISICLEYVEDQADEVYIYASHAEGITGSEIFYLINDTYVECHKVNDAVRDRDEQYDVSGNRQSMVLRILCEDIKKMKLLCIEYQQAMPIEMKLVYQLLHTIHDTKLPEDFADEWFEEVKRNKL